MKTLKKIIRVIMLILLIIMALSGVGLGAAIFGNQREKYMDKEIRIEVVDKKQEEEDGETKAVE